MGFEPDLAECGVRVSIGAQTSKNEIQSFVKAWTNAQGERKLRVA